MQKYTVTHAISSLSAARDLIEIATASGRPVRVTAVYVSQDSDDATSESEMLPILIQRASASGSGGSSLTPEKVWPGYAAAACAVEGGNTSAATLTGSPLVSDSFNVLSGFRWVGELGCAASSWIVVRLNAAPSDAIDLKVTVEFEELG